MIQSPAHAAPESTTDQVEKLMDLHCEVSRIQPPREDIADALHELNADIVSATQRVNQTAMPLRMLETAIYYGDENNVAAAIDKAYEDISETAAVFTPEIRRAQEVSLLSMDYLIDILTRVETWRCMSLSEQSNMLLCPEEAGAMIDEAENREQLKTIVARMKEGFEWTQIAHIAERVRALEGPQYSFADEITALVRVQRLFRALGRTILRRIAPCYAEQEMRALDARRWH